MCPNRSWPHPSALRLVYLVLAALIVPRGAGAQLPSAGIDRAGQLTKAPAVVTRAEAVYPEAAKAGHLEGDVTLQIDISAEGRVTNVTVSKSAGHGFDEAASEALKQYVFSPAEIDGVPAAVQIEYRQHFAYVPPPPPPAPVAVVPPVSLRGRVIERASRVPIVGAAVQVSIDGNTLEPAITDAQGQFEVHAPAGQANIEVRDVAHRTFTTQETIRQGEQVQVTYYMMPKSFGKFETVVRGQRDKKEVSRHTLQREELQSVPGSFGDALRVVQDLPGLARTPYSTGGLIIRGSAAYDTGTYFDGVQLPLIFHFGAGPSVVNSEFLDKIDFYPGGFGARYGRAIGGILDVDSRASKTDGIHGSVKIDLIDTGIYFSSPITGEITASLAARRSYVDGVLKLVLGASSSSVTVAPVYYDYQARIDYHPKALANHKFKLFFMGSDDLLSVVSSASTGPSFQINSHQGFQRLSGEWAYHKNDLTLKTMVFFGFDQVSAGIGTSTLDSPATISGLREDAEVVLHPAITLRGGLDLQLRQQGVNFSIAAPLNYSPFPGALPAVPLQTASTAIDQYNFGEWLELDIKTTFGLRIIPSFRLDVYHAYGKTPVAAQPRLIVRQELHLLQDLPTVLKGSVGWYSELPSPQYANPVFGNPSLPPQKALQFSLGVEQRITPTLSADVAAFWSKRSDLAVATANVSRAADGTVKNQYYDADGRGDAYGVEVFLRQELSKQFFGWLAYTLAWSQQRDELNKPLYYTPYDERHILTLIGQYRFGNGWQLGGRFRLVTSAPMTPVTDATYAADQEAYTPVNGPAASGRGPVFHQLDVRVDKIWLYDTWQLGLYLDIQNIYDRQNQDFEQYDYRYQGSRSIPDIPILPTLGIKGVF